MLKFVMRSFLKTFLLWLGMLLGILQVNSAYADFLPPNQAFHFKALSINQDHVELTWDIATGYYLYHDQFKVSDQQQPIKLNLPAAEDKDDPNFGLTKVHYHQVKTTILVKPNQKLNIQWQGCAQSGLCYPVQRSSIQLNAEGLLPEQHINENQKLLSSLNQSNSPSLLAEQEAIVTQDSVEKPTKNSLTAASRPIAAHLAKTEQNDLAQAPVAASQADIISALPLASEAVAVQQNSVSDLKNQWNNDQFFFNLLSDQHVMLNILVFLGLGILLAFLPCSLPLIPILSGILVQQKRGYRAALIASLFVFGMAMVYAVMGLAVAQLGYSLQRWFQSPVFISIFALLFVLFALNLFGLFQLSLPQFMLQRLDLLQQKQKGGTFLGALLMGMLAALIVGPCMSAPLAGALLFVAQLNQPLMGASYLFVLGVGIGIPLFIASVFGAHYLPKPGLWMDRLKFSFGFVMLGLALYFVRPFLPALAYFLVMAALLLALAGYCAAGLLRHVATRLSKILIILLIIALTLTAAWYARQAIEQASAVHVEEKASWIKVRTMTEFNQALAEHSNQAVVIDVYADWCVACQPIEQQVFPRADVQSALTDVVRIKFDLTQYDPSQDQWLKEWQVLGPPTMIFLNPQHVEQRNLRLTGTFNAPQLIKNLTQLAVKKS